MKVSLFLPNLGGGGVERAFINLILGLSTRIQSVELVVCELRGDFDDQIPSLIELKNISIINLKCHRVIKSIRPLVRYLDEANPDIMISAMPHCNLALIFASFFSKAHSKILISTHASPDLSWKFGGFLDRIYLLASKYLYRFASGLVAVSEGLLSEELKRLGRFKPPISTAIYNPILSGSQKINPLRLPKSRSKPYLIISAGRLSPEKNLIPLLKLIHDLRQTHDVNLKIYGEGPDRPKLEKIIRELDLTNYVELPGFVTPLHDRLVMGDLFILTSHFEGFGNVLVDALAAGCPVISVDCPSGPREILKGGEYGILVEVDSSAKLLESVKLSLSGAHPEYDSCEAVSRFMIDKVTEEYLALFNKLELS